MTADTNARAASSLRAWCFAVIIIILNPCKNEGKKKIEKSKKEWKG